MNAYTILPINGGVLKCHLQGQNTEYSSTVELIKKAEVPSGGRTWPTNRTSDIRFLETLNFRNVLTLVPLREKHI